MADIKHIERCCFSLGPKVLRHSELMRMHVDEGYQIEAAREMSYDPENVETYAARLDTFRSDWFDAAEVSQAMRMQSPAVPATPTEGKDDEKKTDVKLESKENEDKPTE